MSVSTQEKTFALHCLRALRGVVGRELGRFVRQPARLGSALVRPLLWFVVFAAGFHQVVDGLAQPPYTADVTYQEYILPGLLGMIALFNGMQSSLSMVYDREMGLMRLLLIAPLARGWLLAFKLVASTVLSVLQMALFLLITLLFATLVVSAALLGAFGLLLSVYVRQIENFAGAMNFVIFPMFFISPALYPLFGSESDKPVWLATAAWFNPFSHAVEAIRYALHGQINLLSWSVMVVCLAVFFAVAKRGYDPQRGWSR
jgi:ABC-2 type transport system permease protein